MESSTVESETILERNKSLVEENGRLRAKNSKLVIQNNEMEAVVSKKEAEVDGLIEKLRETEKELQKNLETVSRLKEEANSLVPFRNEEKPNAVQQQDLELIQQENLEQKKQLEEKQEIINSLQKNENILERELLECKKAAELVHEINKANMKTLQDELDKQKIKTEMMADDNLQLSVQLDKQIITVKAKQEIIHCLERQLSGIEASLKKKFEEHIEDLVDKISFQRNFQVELMATFLENDGKTQLDRYKSFCEQLVSNLCSESNDDDASVQSGREQPERINEHEDLISLLGEIVAKLDLILPNKVSSDDNRSKIDANIKSDVPEVKFVSLPESLFNAVTRDDLEKATTEQVTLPISSPTENHEIGNVYAELRCKVCRKLFKSKKSIQNHQAHSRDCRKTIRMEDAPNNLKLEQDASPSSPSTAENKSKEHIEQEPTPKQPTPSTSSSRKRKSARNKQTV